MAAYAHSANLMSYLQTFIRNCGPCFAPSSLKLMEFAYKELQSFQQFLSALDGGTRDRMKPSFLRFTTAMAEFVDVIVPHIRDQIDSQLIEAEKARSLVSLEVESIQQHFHVIFEVINKLKQERFNGVAAGVGGNKSKWVGLSDVYNKLKQDIVVPRKSDNIKIFTVVGMAGIGKTTLAEAIFEDLDMLEWFEHRVWVSAGKNCQLEEISRCIMRQLNPKVAKQLEEEDKDAGPAVGNFSMDKRCLVVLDDVWDAQVLDHLEALFWSNRFGCRVILTSRCRRLIRKAKYLTEIRLLNEKESWVLLREKLFGGNNCPPDLEKVGKKIAIKCDGLPLTIVTVANLLSQIPESVWIDVATQRKHQVFTDAYVEISKVLYPSYEDIPQQLKLCFLYMAVFSPNYRISRSRLTNMWFVEGLLESNTVKSSEECADEYLEEFSANSLIMVYQKKSKSSSSILIEKPKSCGLHTSWWHLCYTEARKINFFYVLISREDRLEKGIQSQSRLSIHNNILFAIKDVYDSMEKNSASTACSLLCLGPYHRYPVPICFGLRFLKTLDALSIRLYEFPLDVLKLEGLKYFALTCDGELPASISKFQNLQFFIVLQHHSIRLHGAPSYLPVEIWDMKELKHFQIRGRDLPDDMCSTILPNLSTLLDVSGHSCTKNIFERIPHLKKLGIQIELTLDDAEPLHCFDHIFQLKELETLKCVVVNPVEQKFEFVSLPSSFSCFPLGLKKLTLGGFGYPWEDMSKITLLPCLEVLKLRCNSFRGPKWEVEENGFRKLKFLEIEDLDLMQWKIACGSFDELESISIKYCYILVEFHWELNLEHQNIKKIEIVDSNPSLENQIREDMLRQGYVLGDQFSHKISWEAEDCME